MSSSAQYYLPAPSAPLSLGQASRAIDRRRYVDAVTRDYVLTGGRLKQDDGFTSKVVLALATRLGSAQAFPTFGSRLHEVKRADEQGRKLAERHAENALAHLTSEVKELKVVASLPEGQKGVIAIVVSGKRGTEVVRADYTATVKG